MKRSIVLLFVVCMMAYHHTNCQKEGDTWLIGYESSISSTRFSIIHLDFGSGDLEFTLDPEERFRFSGTSSTICDSTGSPLLWTNGMQVRGKGNIDVIDTIAYEPGVYSWWDFWNWPDIMLAIGFPFRNGALILPEGSRSNHYYILSHLVGRETGNWLYLVNGWVHSKVVHNSEGTFTTIYKDSLLDEGLEWYAPSLNAVRHANGRDWWLIAFEWRSSKYFAYLVDPSGIHLDHEGDVGGYVNGGHSQTVFSPKGNYIGRTDTGILDEGLSVTLFTFDRCTGEVVLLHTFNFGNESSFQGVAFSPSEQFFYTTVLKKELWQFDLLAEDIPASQTLVGEFDGFEQPGWGPMNFGPMMQTPDGRIYIVPTGGSSEFLHVIDRPDLPASECRLLQHHINLTVPNARTAPNIPNYRLGPLDGSPCDTLGLNNLASSRWRHEPDVEFQPLRIRFTDLSFFEPTTWHWDFGDGQTSDEVSPIHTYAAYGLYHVCQTVSNAYAQDSTCHWVEIVPYTAIDDPAYVPFSVAPNPFTNELRITRHADGFTTGSVIITDLRGIQVLSTGIIPLPITLQLDDLPAGMYICTVQEADGGRMTSMKVVKSE